jgi:iron(III) transport system permease protein
VSARAAGGGRRVVLAGLGVALVAFVAVPLAALLPTLLEAPPGALSSALAEGRAAWNTALLCAGALGVALIAGVPTGLALARAQLPRWLAAACTLPYAVPPYVTTLAWIQLANPTNGLLTAWLPLDVYSLAGMCWVLGLHLSPLVALSLRDALGAVDPALEEAARVSGASPLRVATDASHGRTLRDALAELGAGSSTSIDALRELLRARVRATVETDAFAAWWDAMSGP